MASNFQIHGGSNVESTVHNASNAKTQVRWVLFSPYFVALIFAGLRRGDG